MEIFAGLLIVFFAFKLMGAVLTNFAPAQASAGDSVAHVNGITPCPPHKWEYNSADRMQCQNCKKHPGD